MLAKYVTYLPGIERPPLVLSARSPQEAAERAAELAVVDAEEAFEVLVSLDAEPRAWGAFRVRARVTWHAKPLKASITALVAEAEASLASCVRYRR